MGSLFSDQRSVRDSIESIERAGSELLSKVLILFPTWNRVFSYRRISHSDWLSVVIFVLSETEQPV